MAASTIDEVAHNHDYLTVDPLKLVGHAAGRMVNHHNPLKRDKKIGDATLVGLVTGQFLTLVG